MKRRNRGRKAESEPDAADLSRELMTLQDVADYLHCHYTTAYRMVCDGRLPGFQVSSLWRFRRADLQNWVAQQHVRSEKPKAIEHTRRGRYRRKS